MSRRMGYLSDEIEDSMMTESRRRSGRTGRFVRSRMDDYDEQSRRGGRERMERRSGYSNRMDDERMESYDFDSRRRGRGYRSEMRESEGRHGSDRDGYD